MEGQLQRKSQARALTVEDLVGRARRGLIRVPSFQRGLKWLAKDVIDLLDSVYRGFPIGVLLLWERAAKAEKLKIGPIEIAAPETSSAWWVVDGQQRLTALTASLGRSDETPLSADDPYSVYFDPTAERFLSAPRDGGPLPEWVPVATLLDAAELGEWLYTWSHGRAAPMRKLVLEAGKRIREYQVPAYVVDTDDEDLLREIFYRVNSAGHRLEWSDVHDALFGRRGGEPSTLTELSNDLAQLGMGDIANKNLLVCLMGMRGLDVTRTLADHRRADRDVLSGAAAEAAPVLRRALTFLRTHCEIPHLRLLPYSTPLYALSRLFAVHPELDARTNDLLARWIWRGFLTRTFASRERTLARRAVAAIQPKDLEGSIQALLELVPREPAEYQTPDAFDARAAESRLAMLGLFSLGPRDLETGAKIDVPALLEAEGSEVFQSIMPAQSSAANRLIHPGTNLRRAILTRIDDHGIDDAVLKSHAIDRAAARAIQDSDAAEFVAARSRIIERAVTQMGKRIARWGYSDRPSLKRVLG